MRGSLRSTTPSCSRDRRTTSGACARRGKRPTEQPEVDQLHPRAVLYPGNHPHMRHPAGTAFVST